MGTSSRIGMKHMTFEGCCDGLRTIFDYLQTHFHDKWNWMDADFFVEAMQTHHAAMQSRAEKAEGEVERLRAQIDWLPADQASMCRGCGAAYPTSHSTDCPEAQQ